MGFTSETPRIIICCLLLLLCACAGGAETSSLPESGCIEEFDPSLDYFPEKAKPEFAQNFSVEYHNSYKLVTLRPADGEAEHYLLLQCGAPRPVLSSELPDLPVITIPVRSLFSSSASHMPLLVDLDHVEVLTGVGEASYITTEPVLERIRQGLITEYAPNDIIDTELVILKAPSVLMSSGGTSEAYAALRKAGIAVVSNVEWQERTALARAEWLKFMALFLNEEGKANQKFEAIRNRYAELLERTRQIPEKDRPRVMTGTIFRGMFEIAGGESYVARLISDAGGAYVWADNKAPGGVSVDIEAQIARASDADFWINGGEWRSRKAMLREESRYERFKAFQNGNVWVYNLPGSEQIGYDYWSRGVTRPDLILADLIKILHPELAADHEFVWYRQVPAE